MLQVGGGQLINGCGKAALRGAGKLANRKMGKNWRQQRQFVVAARTPPRFAAVGLLPTDE
jgi:hypothetical protein